MAFLLLFVNAIAQEAVAVADTNYDWKQHMPRHEFSLDVGDVYWPIMFGYGVFHMNVTHDQYNELVSPHKWFEPQIYHDRW